MPTLRFESVVNQSIDRVWAAFQDVDGLLPALTPPSQGLVIESAGPLPPRVGTVIELSVKGPIGRMRWTATYTALEPPRATVTGIEARFVDEQTKGPFKSWRHSHEFEAASDTTTRCIDVVDYVVPLGVLGSVADLVFVRRQLNAMFAERHRRMATWFGNASAR